MKEEQELRQINLISAQQLPKHNNSPFIQTYVVSCLNTDNQNLRLVSRTDTIGNHNPTWNGRFVFPVDADWKTRNPDSCLNFEVYRVRKMMGKDHKIGEVNVRLLGNWRSLCEIQKTKNLEEYSILGSKGVIGAL